MALGWIQVDANLRTHRKAVHLAALTGDRRAWTYLVELWSWASQNEPTGLIRGAAARLVVEQVAGWTGEAGRFVESLIAAKWIDEREDGLYLHDWHDHQGAHIAKAEADAERQRQNRENNKKRYGVQQSSDGRPVDESETSGDGRVDVAKNPSDVQGKKKRKKKTKKEEAADAAAPLFGPDEVSTREQERKRSEQETFAEWFESERREALGAEWSEDFELGLARLNTELGWLTEADQDLVSLAARIYLADPKRRGQSPPCQLRWFARDRAEYLDKARRQIRGAA